jgi:predicted RNA-binding Zn-ribbon protein involved in translation (DUF1610 family)
MAEIEFLDSAKQGEVVDLTAALPHGQPCSSCGSPVDEGDHFCPACGAAHATPTTPGAHGAPSAAPAQKHFRCNNCGSEVAVDSTTRSYVCPFCDSTYVVEFSAADSPRQPPEFVIGFAVTPDKAQELFRHWVGERSWFRPGDLPTAAVLADKLRGVYLPFWSFSMLASSNWSASIGEYWYRTETYTTFEKGRPVTRTRRVQETEWWPLDGRHRRFYSGFLVSGSKGLPQAEAERVKPFNLPALKRYEPYYLAGWLSEEYSIAREAALEACQREFQRWENGNVAAFLPGDTHRSLQLATQFSHIASDLCLLPVYIFNYRYQSKTFRVLINGQTGKVAGDKPLSPVRIGIAVGAGIFLVLIAIILWALFSR